MEVGGEVDYIHIATLSPPDIKMGSDESHFNVSLLVRDKVTKTASILKRKESGSRFEPRSLCFSTSLTP